MLNLFRQRAGGVTLTSCLLAVALISILALFATPTFNAFIDRAESKRVQSILLSEINFARITSLTKNTKVIMKPLGDTWAEGQAVYVGGKLERIFPSSASGVLVFHGFMRNSDLTFDPKGAVFVQNGHFTYHSLSKGWQIIINQAGRARVVDL